MSAVIAPGLTIGILGGGQLGRMTALAAAALGYRCHVFCQDAQEPAAQVTAAHTLAAFDDAAAIARFCEAVDVVTLEFENLPIETVQAIERAKPMRPGAAALAISQDRRVEKDFINAQGATTVPYRPVNSLVELDGALNAIGRPAVLKTNRLGYDGKGQVRIDAGADPAASWAGLGGVPAILEGWADFAKEISVIVARTGDGQTACYVPVENQHENHILARTMAPAVLPPQVADEARAVAIGLAHGLQIVGLLSIEMFVTGDDQILVNEIAPRPHNSGHWTIDACGCSQFEQLVRCVCNLPLGDPERHHDAVMENLIGGAVDAWHDTLSDGHVHLHLYGKAQARPGRKMGHVTRLLPRS
ncbi:MAG: 5-(carboxyamino)imidazole ribonucleotide synthase [Alphaproteobacteria bacterium]